MDQENKPRIGLQDGNVLNRFTFWAVTQLGLELRDEGEGIYELTVPASDRTVFDGAEKVRLTFDQEKYARSPEHPLELVTPDSRTLNWLIDQVHGLGNVSHAQPARQPHSIHALSPGLFAQYQLDGGTVDLAGCTIEDRPILRATTRLRFSGTELQDELWEIYFNREGELVSPEEVEPLGVEDLAPIAKPPRLEPGAVQEMLERSHRWAARWGEKIHEQMERGDFDPAAEESSPTECDQKSTQDDDVPAVNTRHATDVFMADQRLPEFSTETKAKLGELNDMRDVQFDVEVVGATLIWCKFVQGKLRFTFGSRAAENSFSGWAATLSPPPYHCPYSGLDTYRLSTTDDGRIVATEAIEKCQISGERVLMSELVTCSVTGERMLPKYAEACPVSGKEVKQEELVVCKLCQQGVHPAVISQETCSACRQLAIVKKDDPRLARLLDLYPPLDRWPKWKISETHGSYILSAWNLFKQLYFVVSKETSEPLYAATRGRPFGRWTVVENPLESEWFI